MFGSKGVANVAGGDCHVIVCEDSVDVVAHEPKGIFVWSIDKCIPVGGIVVESSGIFQLMEFRVGVIVIIGCVMCCCRRKVLAYVILRGARGGTMAFWSRSWHLP